MLGAAKLSNSYYFSTPFFIILLKFVKKYETKRKVLRPFQSNQDKISSFESITQDLPFFRTLFFVSSFSSEKYSRSKKKKKTRDLDFSKHVTCVLQFLSSHELLIGRYVLSTFQVRLIRRIIRIFKFIFSITISIEHFLFFFFFSSKYINYIRRSTIYKRIYSAMDNVPQEKNKTDSKFFSSSRTPCDLSRPK